MYIPNAAQAGAAQTRTDAAESGAETTNDAATRTPEEVPQAAESRATIPLSDLPLDERIGAQFAAAAERVTRLSPAEGASSSQGTLSEAKATAWRAAAADFQQAMEKARQDSEAHGMGWVQVFQPTRGGGADPAVQQAGHTKQDAVGLESLDKNQQQRPGYTSTLVFSESAFRRDYLSQENPALNELAKAYGASSVQELLAQHPEFNWSIFSTLGEPNSAGTPLNGEPPPAPWIAPYSDAQLLRADDGQRAMMVKANDQAFKIFQEQQARQSPTASLAELRSLDELIARPAHQWLLASYAGGVPSAQDLNPEWIQKFGVQRAQVLTMLQKAQSVQGTGGDTAAPVPLDPLISKEQLGQIEALTQEVTSRYEARLRAELGIDGVAGIDGFVHNGSLGGSLWVQGVDKRFVQSDEKVAELAKLWGFADGAAMLAARPSILRWIADPNHDLHVGPAIPGYAMAAPEVIGSIDLQLIDPRNQALVAQLGGPPPTPSGPLAEELVRQFGVKRYQAMTQLSTAMAAVRQDYIALLNYARATAQVEPTSPFLRDGKFSVEAFTAWYESQPGLVNQAFAEIMGPMSVRTAPFDDRGDITIHEFGSGVWRLSGGYTTQSLQFGKQEQPYSLIIPDPRPDTGRDAPGAFVVDPQNPPDLNTVTAVAFDPAVGWMTSPGNIHHEESVGSQLLKVAVIVTISVGFAYGASVVGAAAAGAGGGTMAGAASAMAQGALTFGQAVAAGAAAGATGAAMNAALSSDVPFRWKDVLRGALNGAVSAGLASELHSIKEVKVFADQNAIAYKTLLNGSTQALIGESFRDGLVDGFIGGVADRVDAKLSAVVNRSATMTAGEKAAALAFVHTLSSAIRIAADPTHPSAAFASAFLNSVIRDPDLHALAEQSQLPGPAPAPVPGNAATPPLAQADDPTRADYWRRLLGNDPRVATLPPDALLAGGDAALALSQLLRLDAQTIGAFNEALGGRALSGELAAWVVRVGAGAMMGIGLILAGTPSNAGQSGSAVMLDGSNDRRLVLLPGAKYGQVEYRTAAGDWLAEPGEASMAVRVGNHWEAMTDAQYSQYVRPAPSVPPAPAAPTPAPAPAPIVAAPSPPAPSPAPAAPAPAPAPHPPAVPAPMPVPAPAPVPSNGAGYVTPPVDTTLPGYGEDPTPLPDTTLPPTPGTPVLPPGPEIYPLPDFHPPIVLPGESTTPVVTPPVVTPIQNEHWSDSIYEARPSVDEPTWHYPIRDDLDNHLVNVDSPKGSGGHNHSEFVKWVQAQPNGKFTESPTDTPGIVIVHASWTKPNGGQGSIDKTTYDPAFYSDAEMNRMAREAGRLAWDRYKSGDAGDATNPSSQTFYNVTVKGVKFRAYINNDAAGQPSIGNIHPISPDLP